MLPAISLEARLALAGAVALVAAAVLAGLLVRHTQILWLAVMLATLIVLPVYLYVAHWLQAPSARTASALADGMARLRDKDFSAGLALSGSRETQELVSLFNDLSHSLRDERQTLYQRELMLDTVIQSTPLAMVLTNAGGRILYANAAARQLFLSGRPIEGMAFHPLVSKADSALQEAVRRGADGLFTVEGEANEPDTYHLSYRRFALNAQQHDLYLFKRLTHELNRQEVATWKKVIRVISHELNNSLAPMSSLAHSGRRLVAKSDNDKLDTIFRTIEERAAHLKGFIQAYAKFAKLPQPQLVAVPWKPFVERLRDTVNFNLAGELPEGSGWFDETQLEQVLINLIKNAHESGSPPEEVRLRVTLIGQQARIDVIDKGAGMSEVVLGNALLPFYSTKRSGTGLGLPLSREIVEAHGGRLSLSHGAGGGLVVSIWLPDPEQSVREEEKRMENQ